MLHNIKTGAKKFWNGIGFPTVAGLIGISTVTILTVAHYLHSGKMGYIYIGIATLVLFIIGLLGIQRRFPNVGKY